MQGEVRVYSLPRWRLTRWLVDVGPGVPDDIRVALVGGLFGTLPVFAGGLVNTLIVSAVIAARMQTPLFVTWFLAEVTICLSRLIVLVVARRAAVKRRKTPTDIYLLLGVAWSVSVGYGVIVSLLSGDWIVATVACLSAAAMVGGICFRNFGAPRLTGVMILTSIGPCFVGAALAGQPLLYVVLIQAPMYFLAMTAAAFKLNKMLVATMRAERENDHRARHDALTGLSNRRGLADAVESRLAATRRSDQALALLFLDLDGFKIVNDTYGHAAGDTVLQVLSRIFKGRTRETDIAARLGGDEFAFLLYRAEREDGVQFANDLLDQAHAQRFSFHEQDVRVGLSIGVACSQNDIHSIESLYGATDEALYEAKRRGRNQIVAYPFDTPQGKLKSIN